MLNTRWWAVFQSREEAEWIYPHIVRPAGDASETERHREFVRAAQNLRRQHFYLYVKGQRALPLRAPDVPDPESRPAAELRTIFRREIASRSTMPAKTATELIAKWEADIVDDAAVPPAPAVGKRPASRGMEQLLRDLGVEK
ncbi:MAG TPA: hypothetical protein VEU30_01075 [Thermoanaerobaculia bacterium]|nr:hypothetical protein [Thermoanaerobaculia bacterium]